MGCGTKCMLLLARLLMALACLPAAVPYTLAIRFLSGAPNFQIKSPTEAMPLAEFALAYSVSLVSTIGLIVALIGNKGSIKFIAAFLGPIIIIISAQLAAKQSASDEMVSIATKMDTLMPFYNWDERNGSVGASAVIDEIQRSRCCGVLGPNDWWILRPANMSDSIYPASCCDLTPDSNSIEGVGSKTCIAKQMNRIGCLDYYHLARQAELTVKTYLSYDLLTIALAIMTYLMFYNQYDAMDGMCYS